MADAAAADTAYDLPTELREKLRAAIAKRNAERQRLDSLSTAQTTAHTQYRHAQDKLHDANEELRRAKAEERSRLAYAFASGGQLADDPVAAATASVAAFEAEVDQLKRVESALSGEIDKLNGTVRTLTNAVYRCMADLVTSSDEFQLLIESQKEAFKQLRSIKLALRAVTEGLHGFQSQPLMDLAYLSEPVTDRRVGYGVDEDLVGSWVAALATLADDPDADLPLFG
jgi:hypothetical protein